MCGGMDACVRRTRKDYYQGSKGHKAYLFFHLLPDCTGAVFPEAG
jgi:hypothetical protein